MTRPARVFVGLVVVSWVIVGALVVWLWPIIGQLSDSARVRRTFFIPGENMLPTLAVNDRVRPLLPRTGLLRRGAVVIFHNGADDRVGRIVGIGGDIVALRRGLVVINGTAVPQLADGAGPAQEDGETGRLAVERLPGEAGAHRVVDLGASSGDDYGPTRVPSGCFFILGDNRDRAADTRFPPEMSGVGFVPANQVIGVVDRLLWRAGFRSLGKVLA